MYIIVWLYLNNHYAPACICFKKQIIVKNWQFRMKCVEIYDVSAEGANLKCLKMLNWSPQPLMKYKFSLISLNFLKFPRLSTKFQISLTNSKIPWPGCSVLPLTWLLCFVTDLVVLFCHWPGCSVLPLTWLFCFLPLTWLLCFATDLVALFCHWPGCPILPLTWLLCFATDLVVLALLWQRAVHLLQLLLQTLSFLSVPRLFCLDDLQTSFSNLFFTPQESLKYNKPL